jgi:hypothetical protein
VALCLDSRLGQRRRAAPNYPKFIRLAQVLSTPGETVDSRRRNSLMSPPSPTLGPEELMQHTSRPPLRLRRAHFFIARLMRSVAERWLVLSIVALGCDRNGVESPASTPTVPNVAPTSLTPAPISNAGSASLRVEESASPGASEKTLGIIEVKREGEPRVLHAVRAASNAGYDRVVFEFRDGVPGHHLEYVDKPVRDCGAGDVKPIEGDGWLEVRMYPAYAHTEEGQPTVPQRELRPGLPIVREIERTCDFEAVVTWVIGTASPNRYRAFELQAPPRLVVDIDH